MPANNCSAACQYTLLCGCGVNISRTEMAAKQFTEWKHCFKWGRVLRRKREVTLLHRKFCVPSLSYFQSFTSLHFFSQTDSGSKQALPSCHFSIYRTGNQVSFLIVKFGSSFTLVTWNVLLGSGIFSWATFCSEHKIILFLTPAL